MGALEILIVLGVLTCAGACVGLGRQRLTRSRSEKSSIGAGEGPADPTVERLEVGMEFIERRLQTLEERADFSEQLLQDRSEKEKQPE